MKFVINLLLSAWNYTIIQHSIPLLAFASLITAVAGYSISKKTYNKSVPHLFETSIHFNSRVVDSRTTKLTNRISLENNGKGTVFWGIVILKNNTTGNILVAQPILSLETSDIINITTNELIHDKNTQFSNDKKQKSKVIYYIYFWDIYNNMYYYKPSDHDLIKRPSLPKKVNRWNIYHYFKKRSLIYRAKKDGNTYEQKALNNSSNDTIIEKNEIIKKDTN